MNKLIISTLLLTLASCGKYPNGGNTTNSTTTIINYNNTNGSTTTPTITTSNDGYISVASGTIVISKSSSQITGKSASTTSTVTYTSTEVGSIVLDVSSLILVESLDGSVLNFGTITVSNMKVNKLKICGVGGNQKCTQAVIRIYSTDVAGFPGIEGFVNTTDGYGIDVFAGKTTATENVGLTSTNAAIVQSYTIPANDNKLTAADFPSPTYVVEAAFGSAGYGDYTMNLVVEVAVAL